MSLQRWLGSNVGWPLEPVAGWLLTEGRFLTDPPALLAGLAAQLDAVAAPIDRIRLSSEALHPQLLAWGAVWDRTLGARDALVEHGVQLSGRYLGSPVQFVREQRQAFRLHVPSDARPDEHTIVADLRAEQMTDYVALPLTLSDGSVKVLAFSTRVPAGFSDSDMTTLNALANLLAPLIEIIGTRRTAVGLLSTFVGPRISQRILRGQVKRGDGDRIRAAFWYSDLRGFTTLSETLAIDQLLTMLNQYFELCAAAAASRGGEILQFIGDAILIVFEIQDPAQEATVCEAALDAAVQAFESIAVLNRQRRIEQLPDIEFGLGLHLGVVTHANVGSPDRLAFNVVGPAVNLTARIQALTKEVGAPLLVSGEFAQRIARPLRSVGQHDLRGVAGAQQVFTVAG